MPNSRSIHLVGSIGLESLHYDTLWRWASRSWSYGPGISWNIFDAGVIRRNIEVQTELQKQSLADYEQELYTYIESNEPSIFSELKEKEEISSGLEEKMRKAITAFNETFKATKGLN